MLVTGVPGSGKTTLARRLSPALGLPLLAKDVVKETLFDVLGVGDRAWSTRLGAAANEVFWSMLADCPTGAVVDVWLDRCATLASPSVAWRGPACGRRTRSAATARATSRRSGTPIASVIRATSPPTTRPSTASVRQLGG